MVQYAICPLRKFPSDTSQTYMHKDASLLRRAICTLLINADNFCGLRRRELCVELRVKFYDKVRSWGHGDGRIILLREQSMGIIMYINMFFIGKSCLVKPMRVAWNLWLDIRWSCCTMGKVWRKDTTARHKVAYLAVWWVRFRQIHISMQGVAMTA